MKLDIGGGHSPQEGYTNLDPVHGFAEFRCRLQDGIPVMDNSIEAARASHVLEHIPTEAIIPAMNEVFRALQPGGLFEVIVPLFPSWQAMADPTHISFWVEQRFWYFVGSWVPQADYGMKIWQWAEMPGDEAAWSVTEGWEGHAWLMKPR